MIFVSSTIPGVLRLFQKIPRGEEPAKGGFEISVISLVQNLPAYPLGLSKRKVV